MLLALLILVVDMLLLSIFISVHPPVSSQGRRQLESRHLWF